MGNYITKATLIDAIGEQELIARTDRERTGEIDEDVLDSYIAEAEAEVDGYLRSGGYTTPLESPQDPIIPRLCTDVLRFHLWRGTKTPEDIQDRYKAAGARMKDIQRGTLSVKQPESSTSPDTGIAIEAPDRVFTDETLQGF